MKSFYSSSSVYNKNHSTDLHYFKMNLTKTLNSNYLSKFNFINDDMQNKLKRVNRISSIPCIPFKVITNASYLPSGDLKFNYTAEDYNLIKSKFNSPFMFRKSLSHSSYSLSDSESNSSSVFTDTDSGLSSIDSFITDLKECFVLKTSFNKNIKSREEYSVFVLQLMKIFGTGSILRNLVKKYPDKWFYQIEKNTTIMQTPLDKTNLETLEILLQLKREENVPITEIADQEGNTLMHKAIIYNLYEIVRYLLVNYPSLLGTKNCFGFYPIHLCVLKSNMQMLRLICKESKKYINERDFSGLTPAMHAAIEGKYESLKYLLDNGGAKHNKLTKKDKYSLLHLAVQSGSLDSVQYLIIKMGTSYLKSKTKDGATVFHLAAARGHDQILEYLLANKNSKQIKHIKDITGSTPAHDAAENGHHKCLKLLYDAGLDMFEQDMEHITPYDLAMASKNPDCRNFVINFKPTLSFEDGPIQINSSTQNGEPNNNQNSADNTNSIQHTTAGSKKIKLKKISSMLRLRRAKDLNQNEPAYLYTQRFRPAPVSLPQSSQITGFKNGAPSHLHENEDDLNDSAIDEIINQVSNSLKKEDSLGKHESNNRLATKTKKEVKSTSPSLNAAIHKRISRYQQHCQQEKSKVNELDETHNSNFLDKLKTSLQSAASPEFKNLTNLSLKVKKSSLSSSHGNGIPTLIKLSKSGSVNNMLTTFNNNNSSPKLDKKNTINSNKINITIAASPKLQEKNDENESKNKNNSRKTVLFEENTSNIEESNEKNKTETKEHNELKSDLKKSATKLRRSSLTKLIGNSQILANKLSLVVNTKIDESPQEKAYDKLNHDTEVKKSNEIYEPEPDYWDVPYENKIAPIKETPKINENARQVKASSISRPPVPLAEIIVKSISSGSNSTNKSSSSSSLSSSVASEFKKQIIKEENELSEKSAQHRQQDEEKTKKAIAFSPLNDFELIKNELTLSSLNRRYLESIKQPPNSQKQQETTNSQNVPFIPDVDYNDDEDKVETDLLTKKNDYSLNHYSSIIEDENEKKSHFINVLEIKTDNLSSSLPPLPPPLPPPPPPPPPLIPQEESTSKSLVTAVISTESLLQAKQKLKMQSVNQTLPESNEFLLSSPSPVPSSSSSSNERKSPSNSDESKSNSSSGGLKAKKNDFFLKEIQNHRLYNTKKDYVLDYLDRSSSGSNHVYSTTNHQQSKPLDDINESNNNNKTYIVVVNNNNNKSINRTLSSVNLNKLNTNQTSNLIDETSNNFLSKTESFHSTNSEPLNKPEEEHTKPVVQPKIASNYERFPYIRNRQITPQPPKYLVNNYVNYYNIAKRAKSNGPDASRLSLTELKKSEKPKTFQSSLTNKNSNKSVSVDHLNLETNSNSPTSDSNMKVTSFLIDYEANKPNRSSLSSLSEQQNTSLDESLINDTTKSLIIQTGEFNNHVSSTKKYRQFGPFEKTESELDRVFKRRALQQSMTDMNDLQ